jgi:hypothetical protein
VLFVDRNAIGADKRGDVMCGVLVGTCRKQRGKALWTEDTIDVARNGRQDVAQEPAEGAIAL